MRESGGAVQQRLRIRHRQLFVDHAVGALHHLSALSAYSFQKVQHINKYQVLHLFVQIASDML